MEKNKNKSIFQFSAISATFTLSRLNFYSRLLELATLDPLKRVLYMGVQLEDFIKNAAASQDESSSCTTSKASCLHICIIQFEVFLSHRSSVAYAGVS